MNDSMNGSNSLRLLEVNEEKFISSITDRARTEGDIIYQKTIEDLTSLSLPVEMAREYWYASLEHRDNLSRVLGRNLGLVATLSDFLTTSKDHNFTPQLIDRNALNQVVQESVKDKLTGLNNRAYFDEVFAQQLSLAKRYNTDLSLLFLDIDNFKEINDTHGHQAGDDILKQVAELISRNRRDSDVAIRYGGEEFLLLMPHTGKINGLVAGERIRMAISTKTFNGNGTEIYITISGGISSFPSDGDTTKEIIETADRALYQAKGAGKNNITIFREDRRRYVRVKFTNPVVVKELGVDISDIHEGMGRDISIGGLLFENPTPIKTGSKIQIHTQIDKDQPLLLIGTVVRVEKGPDKLYQIGVSLSFQELERVAKKEIAGLLQAER